MQNLNRRSFVKATVAGVALAVTSSISMPTLAADDLKDIKFAKDPKSLQPGAEMAHTPVVTLEKTESTSVAYGKTPAGDFYKVTVQAKHEATKDHHMVGIALYINGEQVAEHKMSEAQAEASLPMVVFLQRLKAGDELLAVTDCNKHGKWGSKLTA